MKTSQPSGNWSRGRYSRFVSVRGLYRLIRYRPRLSVCPARHGFFGRFWPSSTSQPERTNHRTNAPKTAAFSRENPYNQATTRKPVICQILRNFYLISTVLTVSYKKANIWRTDSMDVANHGLVISGVRCRTVAVCKDIRKR
jgi:hypothetical protein